MSQGEEIAGLVLHAPERQSVGDKIAAESGIPKEHTFFGPDLRDPSTVEAIRALGADIGLSAMFGYILRPELLAAFPRGVLNLHPSYLPYNRGRGAEVWSIIDKTPVGATLHYMDSGVDTGPIVHQKLVTIEPTDTGESLRNKLHSACVEGMVEAWPAVAEERDVAVPQDPEAGPRPRGRGARTSRRTASECM